VFVFVLIGASSNINYCSLCLLFYNLSVFFGCILINIYLNTAFTEESIYARLRDSTSRGDGLSLIYSQTHDCFHLTELLQDLIISIILY